jgi:hypothetical protein
MSDRNPSKVLRSGAAAGPNDEQELELGAGRSYYEPFGIQVRANGGSLRIDLWDYVLGDWVHPAEPEFTISVDREGTVSRAGIAPMRFTVLGGATCAFTGDVR